MFVGFLGLAILFERPRQTGYVREIETKSQTKPELLEKISIAASIVLILAYLLLAWNANRDLSEGRFALWMDERISFDGVRTILHPGNWRNLLWALTDGGDQQYGRSLWNSIAVFAFAPERVFGPTGQIVASRLTQVLLLGAAFAIFVGRLVRNWPLRFGLLFALLATPYIEYYAHMPKPEPIMLCAIALFFAGANRHGLRFGPHWFFLGFAFGSKISVLPAVLVVGAIASYSEWKSGGARKAFREFVRAFLFFLGGLAVAVPILFGAFAILLAGAFVVRKLKDERWRIVISILFSLSAVRLNRNEIHRWIASTFGHTKHAADSPEVGPIVWARYFFDAWLEMPIALGVILFISGAFLTVWISRSRFHDFLSRGARLPAGLPILLAGSAMNAAIFLNAHRLWGFYLFPGTVLILVGIFVLIDEIASNERKAVGWALVLITAIGVFWVPSRVGGYASLARRTESEEYKKNAVVYREITAFLTNASKQISNRIRVHYDPHLFIPDSDDRIEIIPFWGPYSDWESADRPDLIVFSIFHGLEAKGYPKGSPEYPRFILEREGYGRHVTEPGRRCMMPPCYERRLRLEGGGEILVRMQN